jgi:hypothetical protein
MQSSEEKLKGRFILSTAVKDGSITVYVEENRLFGLCGEQYHVFESPLVTLKDILKYFQKELPDRILFVNMKTYDPYPVEYPLYCALHHLPEEGIYGIETPC